MSYFPSAQELATLQFVGAHGTSGQFAYKLKSKTLLTLVRSKTRCGTRAA